MDELGDLDDLDYLGDLGDLGDLGCKPMLCNSMALKNIQISI